MLTRLSVAGRLILLGSLLLFLTGCITTQTHKVSAAWLEKTLPALDAGCRITASSGFAADLSIINQGGARIEAVWDLKQQLNGQILNAIGEDILNFNIDSAGFLKLDNTSAKGESLLQALDFLAQLGAERTRLLLCSGLFESPANLHTPTQRIRPGEQEFIATTAGTHWLVNSKVRPDPTDDSQILIETKISSDSLFIRRTLATISWKGLRAEKKVTPTLLIVKTSQFEIKLSFLDFE